MWTRSFAGGKHSRVRAPYRNRRAERSMTSRRRTVTDDNNPKKLDPTGVGYRNPPKQSRFRKGVSGNPKGRPKGAFNLATVLWRTLQERVVVNENGVRRTVPKLEAALKQLVNQAASGDLAAIRQLTALTVFTQPEAGGARNESVLAETDLKVLSGVVKRIQQFAKPGDDSNDDEEK